MDMRIEDKGDRAYVEIKVNPETIGDVVAYLNDVFAGDFELTPGEAPEKELEDLLLRFFTDQAIVKLINEGKLESENVSSVREMGFEITGEGSLILRLLVSFSQVGEAASAAFEAVPPDLGEREAKEELFRLAVENGGGRVDDALTASFSKVMAQRPHVFSTDPFLRKISYLFDGPGDSGRAEDYLDSAASYAAASQLVKDFAYESEAALSPDMEERVLMEVEEYLKAAEKEGVSGSIDPEENLVFSDSFELCVFYEGLLEQLYEQWREARG